MIAKTATKKRTATGKQTTPIASDLISQLPLRDIVWGALERVASKQKNPDDIGEGSRHIVNFDVQGLIDGHLFRQSVDSVVTVGHRQTRASSVTPGVPELLAYVLGKLNHATRQRILNDVPVDFASNDCVLPESDPGIVEQAKALLAALRSSRTVQVRAPFRCQFMMTD